MKIDPLKQYAKLQQQLIDEKASLEQRLREINQVLGVSATQSGQPPVSPSISRRGRRGNSMSLREAVSQALAHGPLSRKELAKAVAELGYVSKAKDPLASMGVFLYSKNSPFLRKEGKFFLPEGARAGTTSTGNGMTPKKKRTMSPEARAKISASQRAAWAQRKRSK